MQILPLYACPPKSWRRQTKSDTESSHPGWLQQCWYIDRYHDIAHPRQRLYLPCRLAAEYRQPHCALYHHQTPPLARFPHSTGHTGSSKNCQGKRAVLKVFWSARYCGGENAGKHGIDTGRALYGQTVWGDTIGGLGVWGQMSGAFSSTGNKIARPVRSYPVTTEDYDSFLRFDAAALWGDHAGNEFTPEHYRQSVALYLGSPAEV